MDFSAVLIELKKGRAVRRKCWHESANGVLPYVAFEEDPSHKGKMVFALHTTILCRFTFSTDDILAEDWELA